MPLLATLDAAAFDALPDKTEIGKDSYVKNEKDNTFTGGAIQNIKDFVQAIRAGTVLNNGAESVQSTYTGILGRMAASRERMVTWDEMVASNTAYDGKNGM